MVSGNVAECQLNLVARSAG